MPDSSLLLMWTALPRGIDTTQTPAQARLSVLLSPRVTLTGSGAAGSLADVPDLLDWPARLAGLQFTVEADPGGGASLTTIAAPVVPATLDSALWQALFPGAIPVQDRVFDQDGLRNQPTQSYGHTTLTDQLKSGYTGVYSASPVALPAHPVIAQHFPALAAPAAPQTPLLSRAETATLNETAVRAQRNAVAADLVAHARGGTLPDAVRHARDLAAHQTRLTERPPGPLFPSDGTPAGELGRLLAFHTVPSPGDAAAPPAAASAFETELHSVITLLYDHPALLSRLGLLVDLTVPAGVLPQVGLHATTAARLRVTVTAAAGTLQAGTTHYSPWTAFVRDADEIFTPRPSDQTAPEMVAGLLNLALPEAYSLGQVDTDGSWLKNLNAASADGSGLPAIRTTGPSLFRADQETVLTNRMVQAKANQDAAFGPAPAPVTLFAEDLTRGYRIDIRDHADGMWRSLHQRDATYSVPGLPSVVIREEGAVQPSGTLDSPDPQQATTLSVHESLARWEGWSLSASPPGQVVGDDGPASLPSTPQPGGVPLTSLFTVVPGSLPRLRFGHSYDVRARAVDLGGGGLDGAGADAALQLLHELDPSGKILPVQPGTGATFTFQRLEPVPAPVLVPREKPTEGESAGRLVIRSGRTEAASDLAIRLNTLVAAAAPDTGVRYQGFCERHLVPPKASQQTAERAGLLDAVAADAAYRVCCKDKGALTDTAVWDVAAGQDQPLGNVTDPFTGGTRPTVELVASGTSAYPVHHEDALSLPYLPDWLSAGAVLCDLPGVPAKQQADVVNGALVIAVSALALQTDQCPVSSVTTIPFNGSWPLLAPLRLQLAAGSGPPAWDADQRVLTVQLPPGQTATIRLSSALPPGALDLMTLWQWYLLAQGSSPDAVVVDYAQHGLTWPLTPFREVTLVHATQQPVLDPTITALTAPRNPGETGTMLAGQVTLDASSTGQVELLASWTDPPAPGQQPVPSNAHVLSTPLPPTASLGALQPGAGGAPDVLALTGPTAYHEFSDTKHRQVTYQALASTRFAEYFPAQVDSGPTTATGATFTVNVPSSAVPPAPRVREAVPMWRWDRPADPAQPRRRYNAGVRVLLEPPWFASGEGEQLAVVLIDPADYPPGEDLRARVTHWGADPVFEAPVLFDAPAAASFPAAGPAVTASLPVNPALPANETQSQAVVLLPHAVTYDSGRGVYVCDIPVDPGPAYAPFVRLAMARYQPSSLPGLELSAVVQLPFVQVLPERQVTLTPPAAATPDSYAVRVDGTTYTRTGGSNTGAPGVDSDDINVRGIFPWPPLVDVTVQERLAGTTDEAGWVTTANAIVAVDSAVSGLGLLQSVEGIPLWTGRISLPAARTPGQFRILVTEYELLDSDRNTYYSYQEPPDNDDPPNPIHPDARAVPRIVPPKKDITVNGTYRLGSRRLVFAEEIII